MRIFTNLIGSGLKVILGAFGTAIVAAVICGGAVLLVAHQSAANWPPSVLTSVTAGVIAALAAYASATTMLLRAIARTLLGVAHTAEDDVEGAVKHHS